MKTMTCRQLGGPCDEEHRGDTADDVIQAQDRHLKDAVAAGDETHRDAAEVVGADHHGDQREVGQERRVVRALLVGRLDEPPRVVVGTRAARQARSLGPCGRASPGTGLAAPPNRPRAGRTG